MSQDARGNAEHFLALALLARQRGDHGGAAKLVAMAAHCFSHATTEHPKSTDPPRLVAGEQRRDSVSSQLSDPLLADLNFATVRKLNIC